MAYARSRSRGISLPVLIVLSLIFVPVVSIGAVGTLWALGAVNLPFLSGVGGLRPGEVAVPMSRGTVPRYTKLTRDHFVMKPMPREEVRPEVILDYAEILGRVLDHEKPAGYAFTSRDFKEKGTRAGLVAGIPPGKRSLTLDAEKIAGIYGLQSGDHIDLLASVQVEMPKGGGNSLAKGFQAQVQVATMQKRASVRVLAQDAVLVTPVTMRQKPTTSRSLKGVQTRMVPVQEIVIAVEPEEVAPLTEAMATAIDIMCVARSGLPDDPGATIDTPGSDPLADTRFVETIVGSKRESQVFATGGVTGNVVRPAAAKKVKAESDSLLSDDEAKKRDKSG